MCKALAILVSAATVAIAPVPAFAHHNTSHSIAMRSAREQAAPCAAHEGEGVITAISGNAVTLRHEPIQSLSWPAMTMTFEVQSGALLEGLAVGDHVRFRLQESGSAHVIDQIVKQ